MRLPTLWSGATKKLTVAGLLTNFPAFYRNGRIVIIIYTILALVPVVNQFNSVTSFSKHRLYYVLSTVTEALEELGGSFFQFPRSLCSFRSP
jgi:hypothetical protein